ncbi:MAG: LPS assembly protein LptD [Limisphaera sp.]|nr:LPS assembly protein LptD [Limisphaera sp.]
MTERAFKNWFLVIGAVAMLLPLVTAAPAAPEGWELQSLHDHSRFEYRPLEGLILGTNGVFIRYGEASLTAEVVWLNQQTGEAVAEGRVRILHADQVWVGERIRYNFRTRQMEAEQFRTGRAPIFIAAQGLKADPAGNIYTATNAWVTTDDVATPFDRIEARRIVLVPGQFVELWQATLYLGSVPVFYLPYYRRSLAESGPRWDLVPGYRSRHGAYLLGTYWWQLDPTLESALHLDYRTQRGLAGGLDLEGHWNRWGNPRLEYYYAKDWDPGRDLQGEPIDADRHRLAFAWLANPVTNTQFRAQVRYFTDPQVERDFFEARYRQNPQPRTYFETSRFWDHFALELLAEPRVNDFFQTVERLPEVRLTGWRQPLGTSPLHYESQSSAGFYRLRFPHTNGLAEPRVEAYRFDTLHQLLLPWTFGDWLHVTPHVGGRLTGYGAAEGPGARTGEHARGLFHAGMEVSFKASRTWADMQISALELDGLRHVIQPTVQYLFVPRPHPRPAELPQFDGLQPSLWMLPLQFPAYNAVDTIDRMHVLRPGLQQRWYSRRSGTTQIVAEWLLFTDLALETEAGENTWTDLVSDLVLRPRSWITLQSAVRMSPEAGRFLLAYHTLSVEPGERWSWTLGHYFLRDNFRGTPAAWGEGHNLWFHHLLWRWDDNWAFRIGHHYNLEEGRLHEQLYTIYRDFRSWTGALTFRVREPRQGPTDYSVAFAFSLKATPRLRTGQDPLQPYDLLGR